MYRSDFLIVKERELKNVERTINEVMELINCRQIPEEDLCEYTKVLNIAASRKKELKLQIEMYKERMGY